MDPLLQLLGVKFLGFVALFGVSSLKGLTPHHPKTKNQKDSDLGYMQAKECLFFCSSLDLGSILIRKESEEQTFLGLHVAQI